MLKLTTLDLKMNEDVLTVTLDREEKHNAFNLQMIKDLISLADWLRENTEIKFVVFKSKGKFFSVGADLFELENNFNNESDSSGLLRRMQIMGQEMVRKLETLEQITISAVHGSAYGAGVVLPLTTDFRYMTESSVFNIPETNVGVFLTWGCTPRLVKAVGAVKAKEIIMLCEDIPAKECLEIGLINKIFASEEEMNSEIQNVIEKIRNKGQLSIRITKKLVNASVAPNFGDIFISEPELVERVASSGETEEKIRQFTESRKKR